MVTNDEGQRHIPSSQEILKQLQDRHGEYAQTVVKTKKSWNRFTKCDTVDDVVPEVQDSRKILGRSHKRPKQVYVRHVVPLTLAFSLPSHRHSHISLLISFHFID